jgi:hypothetical protein
VRPVQDGSNATLLQDALVCEEPDADGASLGTIGRELDGAGPRLGNEAVGPSHDLVVSGMSLGMLGSATPGDVIPPPKSSTATSLGSNRLLLPDSPGSPLPPIDWRQVEDNMVFSFSLVTITGRLL